MPNPLLDPIPVSFRVTLADMTTPVVVESAGEDPLVVLEIAGVASGAGRTRVRITTLGRADPTFVGDVALDTELGDFTVTHLPGRPLRAFRLPPGHLETRHNLRLGLARAGVALLSLSSLPFILSFMPDNSWRALLIAAIVTVAVVAMAVHPRGLRPAHNVYRSGSGVWPMSLLLDERPALQAATDAVESVKEEYGALLSDVVQRIEMPALFDPAVETTRRFTSAIIQWDDSGPDMDAAERSTLAARVRLTFRAAREHAETVGMNHLPESAREPAARAAKALRLASSTTNAGERDSALRHGMEILDSLMLYYLPRASEADAMITGHPVLALPGRRTRREDT